jgi:glycosyltransferase involved in cell wall biosynthesis
MAISVLILTFDEERNIADCLQSVDWSDDVVVLDSFSSDATVDIALASGARVERRYFDDYASQRNFGLREIAFRNAWVLMLDADERVPADLRDELIKACTNASDSICMYRLRRRDHLYGKWIRRSGGYPTWFGRVARVGRVWLERPINEEFKTDGAAGTLQCHLDHYPFNKGFHEWVIKHDRYSTMEAALLESGSARRWSWRDIAGNDPLRRRSSLKALVYALPGRPALVFLALYLVRGGILEGSAGLTFCLLRAWYEFMIDCKRRELKRRSLGLPI